MVEVCTTARELITRNLIALHAQFIDERELLSHPLMVPTARDHYRGRIIEPIYKIYVNSLYENS